MLRLVPLRDRVIIEPKDAATTTAGGIIIPDTYQERPKEGHVRAIGPGRYENGVLIPMSLKIGDVVIFSKYAGTEIKHDGIEYVMIPEDNCNCVVLPLPEVDKGPETWNYQCDCGKYITVPDSEYENLCECGKLKSRHGHHGESLTGETSVSRVLTEDEEDDPQILVRKMEHRPKSLTGETLASDHRPGAQG